MEALAARYPSHRAQCSAHINSRGHVGTAPLIVWSLPRLPRSSHRAWRGATLAEWGFDLSTINRLYSVAHDESHREWKCEVVSMSSSKVPWLGLRPECEVSATLLDLILVVPAEHPSDMTEALRTGNKLLELGSSLSEFMRCVGLDPKHGGKKSDCVRIKDQMNRLFRSIISLDETFRSEKGEQKSWLDMQVVFRGHMSWFQTNDYRFNAEPSDLEKIIKGSWVELTDIFFESITNSAVPLDMRIIQEIKQSPLALDLYAWMTHRTYSAKAPAESSRLNPSFISWKQVHDQFGGNYKNSKDFKKELKPLLRIVKALSNNLCLEEAYGGLNISQKLTRIK